MKKTHILLTLLAVALAVGILFVSCDTGTKSDSDDKASNSTSGFIGEKLEISGQQVYTMIEKNDDVEENENRITFTEYAGTMELDDPWGGTAKITGGKLSCSIGTPDYSDDLNNFKSELSEIYNDVKLTPSNGVKFSKLDGLSNWGYPLPHYSLYRGNVNEIYIFSGGFTWTNTFGKVWYIYVDGNVTISGKGKQSLEKGKNQEGEDYTLTITTKDFSLSLKKGWNALYNIEVWSGTGGSPNFNFTTTLSTLNLNNPPSLKWILEENDDDDDED